MTDKTNAELADHIETHGMQVFGSHAITKQEEQQIIAALRRPEPMFSNVACPACGRRDWLRDERQPSNDIVQRLRGLLKCRMMRLALPPDMEAFMMAYMPASKPPPI